MECMEPQGRNVPIPPSSYSEDKFREDGAAFDLLSTRPQHISSQRRVFLEPRKTAPGYDGLLSSVLGYSSPTSSSDKTVKHEWSALLPHDASSHNRATYPALSLPSSQRSDRTRKPVSHVSCHCNRCHILYPLARGAGGARATPRLGAHMDFFFQLNQHELSNGPEHPRALPSLPS